ncbi:putative Serine hydrolase FSH domain-containing protein [Seiridium cardinale]
MSLKFKFGVLLAGRSPLFKFHDSVDTRERLRIPTLHVHGLQDINLELHRPLFWDCCTFSDGRILEWGGDHRVTVKSKDVEMLVDEILALSDETAIQSAVL